MTNQNTGLAVPTAAMIDSISQMATIAADSKMFGLKLSSKVESMKMIMVVGYSLGINPVLAPNYIYEYNGKFGLLAKTMSGMILKSGYLHSMNSGDVLLNEKPVGKFVEMTRLNPGGENIYHREEFTIAQAQNAGLIKKDSAWEKYTLRMCYWRALSWTASSIFSDVIGGMMSTEEIGMEHDYDGNVLPVQPLEVMPSANVEVKRNIATEWQDLLKEHGAPKIMGFPGGIPTTEDSLDNLIKYLGKSEDAE